MQRVVREVEIACNCFARIVNFFFFNIMKMFPEEVSKFSPCFSCKEFFAQCTGYAVNDISGDAHKSIPDVDGLFKS